MRVMGVDISTKTGVVVLDSYEGEYSCWEISAPKGMTGMARACAIADSLEELMDELFPDIVLVEDYGFANSHTLATLVEIGTMCRYVLRDHYIEDAPIHLVSPPSLKKFVTGRGNSKKDEMRLETYKRWGFENKSDNIIDAHGLAQIGLGMENKSKLAKYQLEVLSKVRRLG